MEKSNKENKLFLEYTFVKYTLTIIPIYLSFLFFVFLDGSILGLFKTMAGYTAVFSLFLLTDEKTYFYIKAKINLLFKNASILLLILFIGLVITHLSNIVLIDLMQLSFINFGILFNPIIKLINKLFLSSFLLVIAFYINICILALLIKFDVVNKIVLRFSDKK
jgi:hypothetical protein